MPTASFSAPAETLKTLDTRSARSGRKRSAQIQNDLGLLWSLLDGAETDAMDRLTADQVATILSIKGQLKSFDPSSFLAASNAANELVQLVRRKDEDLGDLLDEEMPFLCVVALRDWVEQSNLGEKSSHHL
jgi:hypothetical protein